MIPRSLLRQLPIAPTAGARQAAFFTDPSRPTEQSTAFAKVIWLLGIGLTPVPGGVTARGDQ
jgi:hypothetical protein